MPCMYSIFVKKTRAFFYFPFPSIYCFKRITFLYNRISEAGCRLYQLLSSIDHSLNSSHNRRVWMLHRVLMVRCESNRLLSSILFEYIYDPYNID